MPSEKQIEAALEVFLQGYTGMLTKPLLRDMLTAAELAEPAPAARSGAVKVKRPKRVQAAFEVFKGRGATGPNATAFFEYIEQLEAAIETAEPAADAEPDYQDEQDPAGRISAAIDHTRPPESRLREALVLEDLLEKIRRLPVRHLQAGSVVLSYVDVSEVKALVIYAQDALAQGADDESS